MAKTWMMSQEMLRQSTSVNDLNCQMERENKMNPWLNIPAEDYESHMSLPDVAQAQALNSLMASALKAYRPDSFAVMVCTTGNGFEHINPSHTRRAIGVDINTAYLTALKKRFAGRLPCLELVEADVASANFQVGPVSMVFAGLIFEYVEVADALSSIYRSMVPGGILLSVLQLPSPDASPVTDTRFESLAMLAPIMNLVAPSEFSGICISAGLKLINSDTMPLKKGKAFFVAIYQKPVSDTQDGNLPLVRMPYSSTSEITIVRKPVAKTCKLCRKGVGKQWI